MAANPRSLERWDRYRGELGVFEGAGIELDLCSADENAPVPTHEPDWVFQTTGEMDVRAWELEEEDGERRVYLHSEARQGIGDQIITTSAPNLRPPLRT